MKKALVIHGIFSTIKTPLNFMVTLLNFSWYFHDVFVNLNVFMSRERLNIQEIFMTF